MAGRREVDQSTRPYMKYGYILFRGDESDWGYVIEEGRAYHTLIIYQRAAPVDDE